MNTSMIETRNVTDHSRIDTIRSDALGRTVVQRRTEVSTRDLLCFAAGVGAIDARYLDDAKPDGIVAAPGYHCAFEWPCIVDDGYLDAVGISRERLLQIKLHAFQDTQFLSPILPDRSYLTTLVIAELHQVRPGCLVVSEITTTDEHTGVVVTRSLYGSIFRGAMLDKPVVMPPLANLRAEAELPSPTNCSEIEVTRALPQIYTACSTIWNPIHTERKFALAAKLPDIILHGTCTWTMACLAMLKNRPDPSKMTRLGGRFAAFVLPEQILTVESRDMQPLQTGFVVRRADGVLAITHGIMEFSS